jgi:hypothetical protein
LWMWVHSNTEEEKNKIIEMYINQNFKKWKRNLKLKTPIN